MHLVICARPEEPLEAAPRSALVADPVDGASEQWDGFWSAASDEYYARCTKSDGDVEWFRVADDDAAPHAEEARVLAIRSQRARVAVVIAQSPSGRRMLVGSAGGAGRGPR